MFLFLSFFHFDTQKTNKPICIVDFEKQILPFHYIRMFFHLTSVYVSFEEDAADEEGSADEEFSADVVSA